MASVYVKTVTTNAEMTDRAAATLLFPTVLRRAFWRGACCGAVFIAALNFADVWLCVGACHSALTPTTPQEGEQHGR